MEENKSFLKWQNIRISQLGFANNLIIALAIGLLGYIIDFIQTDNLTLTSVQKFLFWIGCSLIIISIGLGIFVVLNRLEDFKLTARIARKRETEELNEIESDRIKSKKLGKITWNGFIWQIVTFIVSFSLLIAMVLISLKDIIT
ncbi:hypothetical protein [Polaribacter sp. SA4-12]|uniref:hypothetical protein n=1 Tax=Polaribacter sp. SA4-12 TaxID=1312072 RepID=UPI000B3C079C|nr:hypothetical protein [Polaribacter sp. SA4-12]ARV13960.1 hypothetical protein BTO07_01830 [Polaribacter sp. SA4-12]